MSFIDARMVFDSNGNNLGTVNTQLATKANQSDLNTTNNNVTANTNAIATHTTRLTDLSINVKSLGALGDGSHDDTTAIQSALNTCHTNGGGEVFIPSGTYMISSILQVYSNTKIKCAKNATIKRGADINALIMNGTLLASGYTGDSNITIEGGIWDGNNSTFQTSITCIAFGHASNITLRDCVIQNVYGWHHVELNAVKNGKVLNCLFKDLDTSTSGKEMLQLDLMAAGGPFPWTATYDNTPCTNILIEGNTFTNGSRAIGSHSAVAGYKHTNIRIIGNHIETMREESIYGYDWENVIIEGNTITDVQIGIMSSAIAQNCDNFTVANNVLTNIHTSDTNSRGIYLAGFSGGFAIRNITIANNKINGVGRHGCAFDYCSKVSVIGNTITACGQTGIWAYGTTKVVIKDNQVTANYVTVTTVADIQVGASGLTTQDTIVVNNSCDKLAINDKTDRLIAAGNLIYTAYTTSGTTTNVQKYSNFIANTWTP